MAISVLLGQKPKFGWYQHAACQGQYDIFDADNDGDYPYYDQAIEICSQCPVKHDCFLAGRKEPTGIWGGVAR